jgi:hypothetical protein
MIPKLLDLQDQNAQEEGKRKKNRLTVVTDADSVKIHLPSAAATTTTTTATPYCTTTSNPREDDTYSVLDILALTLLPASTTNLLTVNATKNIEQWNIEQWNYCQESKKNYLKYTPTIFLYEAADANRLDVANGDSNDIIVYCPPRHLLLQLLATTHLNFQSSQSGMVLISYYVYYL